MTRWPRRALLALTLLAILGAAAAVASQGDGGGAQTRPSSTDAETTRSTSVPAAEASTTEEPAGLPEPRGAGSTPGGAEAVARAFGSAWVNRPPERPRQRAERKRLLSLAKGDLAARIDFAFRDQQAGPVGKASGEVIATETVGEHDGGQIVEVLVTTRETVGNQPQSYGLYLALMEEVRPGAYLVSDWQPQ